MKGRLCGSLDSIMTVLCNSNKACTGLSRKELKSLLVVVAKDYQVHPPTDQQIEIIFLLLTRNNEQEEVGRNSLVILLETIIDVYQLAQQEPISGHFQRIIMELHKL